jgi:hypothetical protein
MKNQTAVEWLVEKLQNNEDISRESPYINSLLRQALAMEKEQIVEAYKADMIPMSDEDGEQYYNETYNK